MKDKFGIDLYPEDYVLLDSELIYQVTEQVHDRNYGPFNGISVSGYPVKILSEFAQKISKGRSNV